MKTDDHELSKYAQMGLAALLPGMQRMIELMQHELDMMRAQLADMQGPPKKRMGRPPKAIAGAKLPSGWPADPEERKREMQRRIANRGKLKQAAKATEPAIAQDPDRNKFRKKMSKISKRRWASMSVRERKQRVAAMMAGRKLKTEGPVAVAS